MRHNDDDLRRKSLARKPVQSKAQSAMGSINKPAGESSGQ
jgi:hypothetical protein